MITTLQKWGNSQGVRIPKQILSQTSFSPGDQVEIVVEYDKIIIRHTPGVIKKYAIKELFCQYETDFKPVEEDWGSPSGKEEW